MSLLDDLPDRCSILRDVRTSGSLGGAKSSYIVEQDDVACWVQQEGANPSSDYEKQSFTTRREVYFTSDPNVTKRHLIKVTSRRGSTLDSPITLEIDSGVEPDASAGFGILYRVSCFLAKGKRE